MDFHSLTRRELQALCKKNKIPANMTNIAMADALKALEIVEGMEEFLKPSESETAQSSVGSPEKAVITSQSVPRTSCRTATRRKPIQEEPESLQISTRTRRGTRRTISGEVENAKHDVPEIPAIRTSQKRAPVALALRKMEKQLEEEADDEKNVPETPAATTTRRLGTVALARRKMEETPGDQKEETTSVRQVYSSRRSTRLLEKKMTELNLNDKEGIEPVQEMPTDLERNLKEDSDDIGKASEANKGMNQQRLSDNLTDDLEALTDKKSDGFSGDLRELEDNVQECMGDNHEVDYSKVKLQQISEVFDESNISDEHTAFNKNVENEVYDENKDDDDDSERKSGVGYERGGESDIISGENLEKSVGVKDERGGESDIISGENLEKSVGVKDEIPEKEGYDGSGFDTFLSDIENPTECLVSQNGEGLNADKDFGSKDSAAVISSGRVCFDVMEPVVAPQSPMLQETNHSLSEELVVHDLVSEDSSKIEFDVLLDLSVSAAAAQVQKQAIEWQSLAGKESDVRDLEMGPTTKEPSGEKAPCDDAETDLGAYEVQDRKSTLSKGKVLSDDAEVDLDHPEHSIGSKQLENEENLTPDDAETDLEAYEVQDLESTLPKGKVLSDDAEVDLDHPEHSIGSKQLENEENLTPKTLNYEEQSDQLVIESSNERELDSEKLATIESAVEVAVDVSEAPVDIAFSTLAADPLPGRMSPSFLLLGLNSDHIPCPMKKSSSKTRTTLDDNKENIDNSGIKMDQTKENGKTDEKNTAEFFKDTSLRQLKKIFKEMVQITNNLNINEEKNIVAKEGRARLALQTLPENRLAAIEPENGN